MALLEDHRNHNTVAGCHHKPVVPDVRCDAPGSEISKDFNKGLGTVHTSGSERSVLLWEYLLLLSTRSLNDRDDEAGGSHAFDADGFNPLSDVKTKVHKVYSGRETLNHVDLGRIPRVVI